MVELIKSETREVIHTTLEYVTNKKKDVLKFAEKLNETSDEWTTSIYIQIWQDGKQDDKNDIKIRIK